MQRKLLLIAAVAGCVMAFLLLFHAAGGVTILRTEVAWVTEQLQSAAVFFVPSITVGKITDNYRATATSSTSPSSAKPSGGKVRVLIVPGHQPDSGGTEFGGLYERDIVVDIAEGLVALLAQNPHYDVMLARTKTGWHPTLQSYFDAHAADIEAFRQSQVLQMKAYLQNGKLLPQADQVYHETASSQAALQLYGINKWANENAYDITLHLHINDDAEHRNQVVGEYGGFAVYVPNHQFSNAAASRAIAEALAARLNMYHATSTLPKEDVGVVEDQELIATGSNNSADGAALLVEYGYIYEPQFQDSSIRSLALADYAYQTYLGLQDFFKDPVPLSYGSISFPYDWTKVTANKGERGPEIYALQAALRYLGYYPPRGRNFSDCPISGKAGPCTRTAIEAYQRAHGLEATGTVGPQTAAALSRDTARPALY